MGKSRSRLAADWFAKLRVNEITQEVEHEDVVAEQEALDAAEARIASDVVAAKALADSEMATAIAGATMASGDILTSLKTVDGAGSGLDADLLDGQHGSYYATASSVYTQAQTDALINNIDALPSQTGNAGKLLGTDGTTASWQQAGAVDDIFYENAQVITSNYTLATGRNAMTAGSITINDGVTITISDGSSWTIV